MPVRKQQSPRKVQGAQSYVIATPPPPPRNFRARSDSPASKLCYAGQCSRPVTMTTGLTILAVGFLLGMRHATDPDHVIAVSTIVGERSIPKAALIGILWGCGHTITIVAVGAAIIMFGLAISARVGLTMEFSVGLMLILLGVLNLTGG